jgi:hypothetical protein
MCVFGLGLSAFSSGTVEIPVGWVYLPSQVGQWRFVWAGFICLQCTTGDPCELGFLCLLKWDSGDFCGLGISASSAPLETAVDWVFSAFSSGTVEIPVEWVYLPQVD